MTANSELKFDEIWERMRLLTGWKGYGELADFMEIKQPSVAGAKKKGTMPIEWLWRVSAGFNGSLDWLFTGHGSMHRDNAAPSTQPTSQLKPSTSEDLQSAPYAAFDALEVVEGMGMLTRIYSSGDTTYIRAINANLMAFSDAITSKKINQDMQTQIKTHEIRIVELEEKINSLLEVRQKVANSD